MGKNQTNEKDFIFYDYKEIAADRDKISFYIDSYECFGWEVDQNVPMDAIHHIGFPSDQKLRLQLKRNRKVANKMELTRLERNFEACVREIEVLESRKTSKATIWALVIGVIGTGFMAGSVFAVTAQPPIIWLCILLAIPAFLGWMLPLYVYRKIVREQTDYLTPLIEEKYDEIYRICEKGNMRNSSF